MNINVAIEGKTYTVTIQDIHARPVITEVNGNTFEVWPEEERPMTNDIGNTPKSIEPKPVSKPATESTTVSNSQQIVAAPLPGVIISIDVKEGESIAEGQTLCTLEAMKMKNNLRAVRGGVIEQVHITPGDQVKHNQPLFTFRA